MVQSRGTGPDDERGDRLLKDSNLERFEGPSATPYELLRNRASEAVSQTRV